MLWGFTWLFVDLRFMEIYNTWIYDLRRFTYKEWFQELHKDYSPRTNLILSSNFLGHYLCASTAKIKWKCFVHWMTVYWLRLDHKFYLHYATTSKKKNINYIQSTKRMIRNFLTLFKDIYDWLRIDNHLMI